MFPHIYAIIGMLDSAKQKRNDKKKYNEPKPKPEKIITEDITYEEVKPKQISNDFT